VLKKKDFDEVVLSNPEVAMSMENAATCSIEDFGMTDTPQIEEFHKMVNGT
jgi:hypothetical protein